ncbi:MULTISPECIES: hypothetical protein [unclassified Rathayibacter]|uniref:hypothetical protein n=1 Tax=unclassified Rathayibacter TaxID=2609250 RepID=UPI0006FA014F|nr:MULTISPECIES: hypothetical protein [unclassified Rathayibacter]KQQ05311.1 hypothetical protein ASF42_01495 [Rathayibacter sp. Leaf294]KQS13173.1 hypothetical protein ASG06_01495 [Rathayibacter sp. Leaf185]
MSQRPVPAPSIGRRTLSDAAAWTVPVLAVAATAPAAAASEPATIEVGAYQLTGTCGLRSIVKAGFLLRASPAAALPEGTFVLVRGAGVSDIGIFTADPPIAEILNLSSTTRLITLTSELAAGTQVAFRTNLSIDRFFTLEATASLPDGYSGTGAKTSASVVASFSCTSS